MRKGREFDSQSWAHSWVAGYLPGKFLGPPLKNILIYIFKLCSAVKRPI